MSNQLDFWNNAHKAQWLHAHSMTPTDFAEEVNRLISPEARILELGCGEGNDSIYFAQSGHEIVATDFSEVIIEQNQKRYSDPRLRFEAQDISRPLEFSENFFDAVYARLSLHYFPDKTTREIFGEIKRVLKPGGGLYFMCKATSDPMYGQGEKIEADMYELNGHKRHFFSEAYARSLMDETGMKLESVELGEDMIYDRRSAFVKVAARKT